VSTILLNSLRLSPVAAKEAQTSAGSPFTTTTRRPQRPLYPVSGADLPQPLREFAP
jgi:hypothetical protein